MGLPHYMDCQIGAVTVWPQPSKTSKLDIQMTRRSGLEYVIEMTKKKNGLR